MDECPICGEGNCSKQQDKDMWPGAEYDCQRCGRFVLWGTMSDFLDDAYFTLPRRSVLSHRLRCQQRESGPPPKVVQTELESWQLDDPLPSPMEQVDRLILWIGDHQPSPPEYADSPIAAISAWIGTTIAANKPRLGLSWLIKQSEIQPLICDENFQNDKFRAQLTVAGWERYQAIKSAEIASSTAFMAMKFGDPGLDAIVARHFKPAVARAGFELRLLSDGQPAGLIDDQLRVRLRTSRFTIADLTHANNGAYWEAGFAEGLGRPVIYTCRKQEWNEVDDNGRRKVHFDTNHLTTIIWDPANPGDAAERLTAMIRATLPAEAKMTD